MGENVKVGRPRAGDYSDPDTGEINELGLKLIQTAAGMGLPYIEIAALLGMSERTFFDRRENFPIIDDVIKEGEADAGLRVANALLKRCAAGDMAAIRWFEMTRKGRSERVEQRVETKSFVIEAPPAMAEEEWEKAFSPQAMTDGTDTPV